MTYDLRGRENDAFALVAGIGSRAWLESFQPSRGDRYGTTAATVESNARLAVAFLRARTGVDLSADAERPIVIVHPDEPGSRMRAGLWARGSFDAGRSVLVFPDPVPPTPNRIEQAFSLRTVAHAFGHAFIARTSGLLPRGESGILDEGFAELVGAGAVASSGQEGLPGAGQDTGDRGAGRALVLQVLERASARAAADGLDARASLETIFSRALALMLPADATLSMGRMATEQAARDLPGGGILERYLTAAWTDAGIR
jgi:hypothetical protein